MRHEKRLSGKRIGVLTADGFEYAEVIVPSAALRAEGATVEVISLHHGRIRGMNVTSPTRTVHVDRTVREANPNAYDALLVPGGFVAPDFLRQSREARAFVSAFDATRKPLATLCHGPSVLASAGVLRGRTLAAWPGIRDDVVNAGATWRDEPVVREGNWVSSRGPQDLGELIPAMIELFAASPEEIVLDHIELPPSSPPRNAPSRVAVAEARVMPGPTARILFAIAAATAFGVAMRRRRARSDTRSRERESEQVTLPRLDRPLEYAI